MSAPASLSRSTRTMAVGTLASRGSGFVRQAVLFAALGLVGSSTSYNLANTVPNVIYELLLGGVLTSVVVPLLVRAARDDGDDGEAYAQRLLTLTVVALLVASVLLVVLAPQIVDLYTNARTPPRTRELGVVLARYFLPQVLFYGAGAVMSAILNTRGRFAAPMWAPVLNNVVVIATVGLFLLLPGSSTSAHLTSLQTAVLGVGTTLGIVVQTVALVPALRATGFRLRPRLDLAGTGLSAAARLARWVFVYVAANQVAYLVVTRLATGLDRSAPGRGYPTYVAAFVLWQLPHAVVAVSVISALLPRMSRAAADDRLADLRTQLASGTRLVSALLVPAVAAYLVLGPAVATVVFAHGHTSAPQARYIGEVLAVFALGLLPFSAFQLQLRAFYALHDTRTPALVNLGVNAVNIAVDLVAVQLLPPRTQVLGLAAGYAASYVAGLALSSRLLGRRLGGLAGGRVVQVTVRCVVAAAVPALAALALQGLVRSALGQGWVAALVAVLVAGLVLGLGYLLLARRMRVRDLDGILGPVLRRLPARPRGTSLKA